MFKRIYAVLLLVLAQISFASWDGSAKVPKTVTVGDSVYYEISTPEELIGYIDIVQPDYSGNTSQGAYLKNDIVFGADTSKLCEKKWERVGAASFWQVFDGRGHTIYGLNATNSLFLRIGPGTGSVQNLNIANSSFGSDTTMYAAAVADYIHTFVQNVNVYNTKVTALFYAGGIAANITFATEDQGPSIIDCNVVGGSVSAAFVAGGVAGYAVGGIKNSTNSARVIAMDIESPELTPNGIRYFGGIAGYISSRDGHSIDDCANHGDVEYDMHIYTSYVGGVAGALEGGAFNLYNDGNVVVKNVPPENPTERYHSYSYVGGVAGFVTRKKDADEAHQFVNRGRVSATVNSVLERDTFAVGGVVGYLFNIGASSFLNTGKVEANGYGQFMKVMSGGVVGFGWVNSYTDRYSRFVNRGDVDAEGTFETHVGGVFGFIDNGFDENSALRESFNYGDITAVTADTATKSDYLNVGGIAGFADGCMISDVYNRGKLAAKGKLAHGDTYVGGILGVQRYEAYHIKNGYSASAKMEGDVVGGIVGNLHDAGIPLNVYYDSTILSVDAIGKDWFEEEHPEHAKTTAELKTAAMATLLNTENGETEDRGLWVFRDDYPVLSFDTLYKEPQDHGTTALAALRGTTPSMQVEVSARNILVSGAAANAPVLVFDMRGRLVASARFHGAPVNLSVPKAGLYIVRNGKALRKVMVH